MSPADYYDEKKWAKIWEKLDKKTERKCKNLKTLKQLSRGVF